MRIHLNLVFSAAALVSLAALSSFVPAAHAVLAGPAAVVAGPYAERIVEGTVAGLESRIDPLGYPVTDVVLAPGGDRFTILGGYKDGLFWVVDEEAAFALGERVRVRLESGPAGLRPVGGREGVERLDAGVSFTGLAPLAPLGPPPLVEAITPESGPAVADDDIEVQLIGTGFGETEGGGGVFYQGLFEHVPADVLVWSDNRIVCRVPRPGRRGEPQVLSGSVKVWTPEGGWSDGNEWVGGAGYHVLFQYAGDSWSENKLPVDFYVNSQGFPVAQESLAALVARSFAPWEGAPFAYGRFRMRGFTEKRAMRDKDSLNVIGWTSPWPHSSGWLAVTWSGIDSLTGEKKEVDVEINGDRQWSAGDVPATDSYDLQTTLTHEFGHWLRLGHVQEPGHVMLAYQNPAEVRRVLADGDRQGAAWIYPTFGDVETSEDTVRSGDGPPLVLTARIADRRGRPVSGLRPGRVYAVADWLDGPEGEITSQPLAPAGGPNLYPESDTDDQGRTRFVIPTISGPGRVRFTVIGDARSVRRRPIVFVAPGSAAAPALWLGFPEPNPAARGPIVSLARLRSPSPRLVARVLDARGRVAQVLFDGPAPAGDTRLAWDPASGGVRAASGLYFLEVRGAGVSMTRKLVLLGH